MMVWTGASEWPSPEDRTCRHRRIILQNRCFKKGYNTDVTQCVRHFNGTKQTEANYWTIYRIRKCRHDEVYIKKHCTIYCKVELLKKESTLTQFKGEMYVEFSCRIYGISDNNYHELIAYEKSEIFVPGCSDLYFTDDIIHLNSGMGVLLKVNGDTIQFSITRAVENAIIVLETKKQICSFNFEHIQITRPAYNVLRHYISDMVGNTDDN